MRVVVDTNVFASAALKSQSWPASVIRWIDQYGGLLKTASTEAQVFGVLQRPYFVPKILPSYLAVLPGRPTWPSYLEGVRRIFAAAILQQISATEKGSPISNLGLLQKS